MQDNFDIVHAHGLRGAWIGSLAAHRAHVPSLFTAHNLVPNLGLLARFCLQVVGKRAAHIVAVSQAVAAGLVRAGLDKSKIAVVPNGIDLTPFDVPFDPLALRQQYGIPFSAPLLVALGRLSPEKGFDVLLHALPHVLRDAPEAILILAGSGPDQENLKSLGAALPVIFPGRIAEPANLLRAADVVVVPSRQEGQGLVALEAMAARRPVVASRVGGLLETITDLSSPHPAEGATGALVAVGRSEDFASAILTFLADPLLRDRCGHNGRRIVEERYTAQRMVQSLEALYRRYARSP